MTVLLEAKNLGIIRQNRPIFRHVNFSLSAGEGIHLIGENGSGKTTFMQMLAGTLPVPFGEIHRNCALLYFGHRPGAKGLLTVSENLSLFAKLYHGIGKLNSHALKTQIDTAIEAVGLQLYAHTLVNQLSAGQQRKVQLARLWLTTPPLWLLDEPLNALDINTVETLGKKCCDHIKNGGALLITSHQSLPFGKNFISPITLKNL